MNIFSKKTLIFAGLFLTIILLVDVMFIYQKRAIKDTNNTVATTPTGDSGNNNKLTPGSYSGTYFSVSFPTVLQTSLDASDCGEMEEENLTLIIPTGYTDPNITNKIYICVQTPMNQNVKLASYEDTKKGIQENITRGLIDNLSEQIIANQKALVYEHTRKDFPGYYEKSVFISMTNRNYRLTWSIEAKDNKMLDQIKRATLPIYNSVLVSLQMK